MDIYLPIAEMSVNLWLLLSLGAGVGLVSGIFGVGGGFLMTPLLIFIGIPPAVAVGSESAQILASSISGFLAHLRKRSVDIKMGSVLVVGGACGSTVGVYLFKLLQATGQVDVFISICYVVFLGTIGTLMLIESVSSILRSRRETRPRVSKRQLWIQSLPFRVRFETSKLTISILVPLFISAAVGLLGAVMGVGGGFIMVPAMIYLIGMPTNVVVGTSLYQISFVSGLTTYLHAYSNFTVDIILALLLIAGGVVGAQFGARIGGFLKGEQLRGLLALLVLMVCIKLGIDLVTVPDDLFSIDP